MDSGDEAVAGLVIANRLTQAVDLEAQVGLFDGLAGPNQFEEFFLSDKTRRTIDQGDQQIERPRPKRNDLT
jgi:hypothetical protein